MNFIIKNNSSRDLAELTPLVQEFYPYAKKHMGFNQDAAVTFESNIENAQNPLGKTAFYDPDNFTVTIFVDNRHPKDIMRSVSHELVHHHQNCEGKFKNIGPTEEGYAQSDPYLRKMEEDAYKRGNLIFRDWENQKNVTENLKKTFTEEFKKQIKENKMKLTKEELQKHIYKAVKKHLNEKTKTDSPDRKQPDIPADRLKPLEEKELEEADDWYMSTDPKDWQEPTKPKKPKSGEDEDKEKKPLKEWYEGSLYGKLLKEYTKR